MSTSTNPQTNDDGWNTVNRALAQFTQATGEPLLVEVLSDLSRTAAVVLSDRWLELPRAIRLAAVNAMIEDAELHIEHNYDRALLVAMHDTEVEARLAAIGGLTEVESLAFCEALLGGIEDEHDERVRAAKAMALGTFVLQAELGDLDDQVAERLRNTLLRLIESDPSVEVQRRALEAVSYISGDPDVLREIEVAYASVNHRLRVSALHAMGRQADLRWLEIVHDEMANDDPEMRFEAVHSAGIIGDQRSVVELIDRLRDDDVEVQLAAIGALGAIGGRLAISTLRRLIEDDSPAIADAAGDALEEAQLASNPLAPLTNPPETIP